MLLPLRVVKSYVVGISVYLSLIWSFGGDFGPGDEVALGGFRFHWIERKSRTKRITFSVEKSRRV
jgi:hypothetical protein